MPDIPTGVSANAGDRAVVVSWNSVNGATAYNLYWATSSGVNIQTGIRIANVTSPYALNSLTNGTAYYFVVTAENSRGESAESAEVSAIPQIQSPAQVTGLSAIPLDGRVELSWNSVSGATGYNLYWSASSGVTPQNGNKVTGVSSPYILSPLVNGTTYYFVVTAENASGEGQPSVEASAKPDVAVTGWSQQELINIPFNFFDTDLYLGNVDINDQGTTFAVWVEEGSDSDTARVIVNQYVGGAWGNPEILTGFATIDPKVVVAPNGDAIVCYGQIGFDSNGFRINQTVWSRRYANGSWSPSEQIDGVDLTSSTFNHGIDMAVDSSGNVIAAWVQDNSIIWANRYDALADSWGTPTLLSTSVRNVQQPAVGVDGFGDFTVVWLQDTLAFDPGQSAGGPSNPTLYASRYSAGSWATATRVGHTDLADWDGAERVDLAVNPAGTAVAVWEQTRIPAAGPTVWSVDTVRYNPVTDTWGTPESIVTHSIYTSWPDVALDDIGNAIATWQPTDPVDRSQRIAKASFYDAATARWGPSQTINIDTGGTDVHAVHVGKDATGNAIAVWMQDGNAQARHYDPVGAAWGSVNAIGQWGDDLAFAMSSNGHAVAITDFLITNNIPWTRSVWANVFTP